MLWCVFASLLPALEERLRVALQVVEEFAHRTRRPLDLVQCRLQLHDLLRFTPELPARGRKRRSVVFSCVMTGPTSSTSVPTPVSSARNISLASAAAIRTSSSAAATDVASPRVSSLSMIARIPASDRRRSSELLSSSSPRRMLPNRLLHSSTSIFSRAWPIHSCTSSSSA
jgi:hypothetical protein